MPLHRRSQVNLLLNRFGDDMDGRCPPAYPHHIARGSPNSKHRLCYRAKSDAAAGTGLCDAWYGAPTLPSGRSCQRSGAALAAAAVPLYRCVRRPRSRTRALLSQRRRGYSTGAGVRSHLAGSGKDASDQADGMPRLHPRQLRRTLPVSFTIVRTWTEGQQELSHLHQCGW
jgi:hypothetical protein